MKLVSMKLDKKALKKRSEPMAASAPDRPAYPWGLTISLDTDTLEKLGLADDLPEVGGTMTLSAKVDVVSVSENESAGGGKSCAVSLQITDLGLSQEARVGADQLYKGK